MFYYIPIIFLEFPVWGSRLPAGAAPDKASMVAAEQEAETERRRAFLDSHEQWLNGL